MAELHEHHNDIDHTSSGAEESQLVVFSYASPFHESVKLAERIFTVCGTVIRMQQKWQADGKGGTAVGDVGRIDSRYSTSLIVAVMCVGFGASVYDCSFIMAYFLEQNPHLVWDAAMDRG